MKLFEEKILGGDSVEQLPHTRKEAFAFYGKQGDKVSFETNAAKSYGFESAPRACWGRSFFKKLDIDIVDQATAEANEYYLDPYDKTGVEDFKQKLAEYEVIVSNIDSDPDSVGEGFGQYRGRQQDVRGYQLLLRSHYCGQRELYECRSVRGAV